MVVSRRIRIELAGGSLASHRGSPSGGPGIATAIVVGLLVFACTAATSPSPPSSSTPASTSSSAGSSVDTSPNPTPSSETPGSSTAPPSLPPIPASASLPVHGSAREIGERVVMAPGPAGGLYVVIPRPAERGSVVALLDSTGKPQPGWPVALGDAFCNLPAPAVDGSIRVVCGQGYDSDSRAYAFTRDGRSIAGWPVYLPSATVHVSWATISM